MDDQKDTPLIELIVSQYISSETKLSILDYLWKHHSQELNVNIPNIQNMTPFLYAVAFGELKIIKFLVNQTNANVFATDDEENNALIVNIVTHHTQMEEKKLEILKFLLEQGLDPHFVNAKGTSILHECAHFGYIGLFEYLLKHTNVDINKRDLESVTPIMEAIYSPLLEPERKYEMICSFLETEKQLDFNISDSEPDGNILFPSLHFGYFDMSEHLLLHANLSINVQNAFGASNLFALIGSMTRSQESKLNYLKHVIANHDANIFLQNKKGETILHLAAAVGEDEIVDYLIGEKNMNVDQQDQNGDTPLMHALTQKDANETEILNTIKLLIETHKANIKLSNLQAKSALLLSFDQGYFQISKYILKMMQLITPKIFNKGVLMLQAKNILQDLDKFVHEEENEDFDLLEHEVAQKTFEEIIQNIEQNEDQDQPDSETNYKD